MSAPALASTLPHRPLRPDDAHRWAALLAAVEAADRRGEHYDAADCAEELAEPDVDFARDSVLVFDGDDPVAYQVLRRTGPAGARVLHTDTAVHPDHRGRGIGTALLDLARRRAAELGADLHVRVPESVPAAVALVEDAGLVPVRWWSELSRELAEPVVPVALPSGSALHRLGPDYDAARW
ncbi:MAG TPA: GNAT family N-acetyltransferase, partial [Pseudonocardia sp.]|nr:GNAT family N-acetyltransferase [Pseudonocardia sp.]